MIGWKRPPKIMKYILLLSLGIATLSGCNGVDKLVNGQPRSRDSQYDTSPIPTPAPRAEPYAVLAGYRSDGEKIYMIHWTNSVLDNTAMLESEVDARGFPKYTD